VVRPFDPLSLVWSIWALIWLVTAMWSARSVAREPFRNRLLVVALMVIGFFPLLGRSRQPAVLAPRFVIGLALTILGLGFAVWARVHLGRFWSGTVTLKENHELVRSGPYAFVRHPIYTGLLTAAAGTALARGTFAAWLALGLIGVACWLKIRAEENLLTNHFGDTYREYRRQVAALIPFVR
jgi:protein-S-isoprenylcysteine O-methyltransferase Ste14